MGSWPIRSRGGKHTRGFRDRFATSLRCSRTRFHPRSDACQRSTARSAAMATIRDRPRSLFFALKTATISFFLVSIFFNYSSAFTGQCAGFSFPLSRFRPQPYEYHYTKPYISVYNIQSETSVRGKRRRGRKREETLRLTATTDRRMLAGWRERGSAAPKARPPERRSRSRAPPPRSLSSRRYGQPSRPVVTAGAGAPGLTATTKRLAFEGRERGWGGSRGGFVSASIQEGVPAPPQFRK